MAENVVTRYDPHFHLGMRVMTLIWCFRGWQVCTSCCLIGVVPKAGLTNCTTVIIMARG
jgi:hypothetical protein